jgi:hypothetical protein
MPDKDNTVKIEDARIIFRNFAGKETKYNREGDRNFAVVLPPDIAQQMLADDWNVRFLDPRDEGDDGVYYLPVAVSYKNKPPKIVMITSTARTHLDQESVETLDYADILTVDLIVNPYSWAVNDKSGIKAYLKTMFVTIDEDDLEKKYAVSGPDIQGE